MNPRVDAYLNQAEKWQEEMIKLRSIILDFGLQEDLKWGHPCYSVKKSNVVIIQAFKAYCAIMFFKGVLLQDAHGILTRPGEQTQAGRQIRFIRLQEIYEMESILKDYIQEAIDVEKAGLKVEFKKTSDYPIPGEFQARLDEIPALKTAFEALTPGRQRAYIYHFSQPKQSQTRESRVEKCIPLILSGKGLND